MVVEFKTLSDLCDVVSHIIYCSEDGTMIVTTDGKGLWIPSSKVPASGSWNGQSASEIKRLLGAVQATLLRTTRLYNIRLPDSSIPPFYHCIFQATITADAKKKIKLFSGKQAPQAKWLKEADLSRLLYQDSLLSPELVEFCQLAKGQDTNGGGESLLSRPKEYNYHGTVCEINQTCLVNVSGKDPHAQLVGSASFNTEVQTTILKQFLVLCYPAVYMCQQVFVKFIVNVGWPPGDEAIYLFRAADLFGRSGLSFREFLYILAAIEPGATHGGVSAELRSKYIFRYFDRDRDNLLNSAELKTLVVHIRKLRKQATDAGNVKQEANSWLKQMGLSENSNVTLPQFLKFTGESKLRGIAQVLRSPNSINQYLKVQGVKLQGKTAALPVSASMFSERDKGLAAKTGTSNFNNTSLSLAYHIITLQAGGQALTIEQLPNVNDAVTSSSVAIIKPRERQLSVDQFSQKAVPSEVLKSIRYLEFINRDTYKSSKGPKNLPPYNWGQIDPSVFSRQLLLVCENLRLILKEEQRMVSLQSPAYIIGDVHGNFGDMLSFERNFWALGPGLCPCTLLFLGDYVDRGPWSLEVVAYLFSWKVQNPTKVYLVRGNHEIRDVQRSFSFYDECSKKFGDKLGPNIWNIINTVFDVMPLSATLDNQIFCCHGGIPPPWLCPTVSAINKIPVELSKPDEQSSLAWDLMWNDPVKKNALTEQITMELMANEGFATNKKRGTAHIFSYEALQRFMNTNGYSCVIRAHEVVQEGFSIQMHGKLITVFSSSKYQGGHNAAALIFCDHGKIRVLRMKPD